MVLSQWIDVKIRLKIYTFARWMDSFVQVTNLLVEAEKLRAECSVWQFLH